MTHGEKTITLKPGMIVHIPTGVTQRLIAWKSASCTHHVLNAAQRYCVWISTSVARKSLKLSWLFVKEV